MTESRYRTSDIGIAAMLLTRGISFLGCTRANSKKAVFEFDDDPDIDDLIRGWFSGTTMVPARLMHDSEQSLKALIMNRD